MVNTDTFLGSGASLTFVPEHDLYIEAQVTPAADQTTAQIKTSTLGHLDLVVDMYIGCTLEFYSCSALVTASSAPADNLLVSSHTVTSNTIDTFHFTPALGEGDATSYYILKGYGAPCPAPISGTSKKRLNADHWLGLLESSAFPNVEVEMKQLNLSLGGSRNWTHQYKGIETASGGNLALMANHGTWLYYALGNCSAIGGNITLTGSDNADSYHTADTASKVYSEPSANHLSQGPMFYRSNSASKLFPPLLPSDLANNVDLLTIPSTSSQLIQYTFTEANGSILPSFSLEHSMAKDPTSLLTQTSGTITPEDLTFVRIARGNRVNTLTLTANENEEVKMTMDLNTRTVTRIPRDEAFEARNGVTTNASLFNFNNDIESFLEPFFFSSGTFSAFGQTFLKVTNLTLTINNNLMDKRYIGVGNKSIKEGIPAQRTYELAFTAMITDDSVFHELLNQTEAATDGTTNLITLNFTKPTGSGATQESMQIRLQDYMLSQANITVPEDKSIITLEGTIMPRTLKDCIVNTHHVLLG